MSWELFLIKAKSNAVNVFPLVVQTLVILLWTLVGAFSNEKGRGIRLKSFQDYCLQIGITQGSLLPTPRIRLPEIHVAGGRSPVWCAAFTDSGLPHFLDWQVMRTAMSLVNRVGTTYGNRAFVHVKLDPPVWEGRLVRCSI